MSLNFGKTEQRELNEHREIVMMWPMVTKGKPGVHIHKRGKNRHTIHENNSSECSEFFKRLLDLLNTNRMRELSYFI